MGHTTRRHSIRPAPVVGACRQAPVAGMYAAQLSEPFSPHGSSHPGFHLHNPSLGCGKASGGLKLGHQMPTQPPQTADQSHPRYLWSQSVKGDARPCVGMTEQPHLTAGRSWPPHASSRASFQRRPPRFSSRRSGPAVVGRRRREHRRRAHCRHCHHRRSSRGRGRG